MHHKFCIFLYNCTTTAWKCQKGVNKDKIFSLLVHLYSFILFIFYNIIILYFFIYIIHNLLILYVQLFYIFL